MGMQLDKWLDTVESIPFACPEDPGKKTGEGRFPPIEHVDLANLPPLAEELVDGVLRVGHKMVVTAPSKAGKTFLPIQLAVAVATGGAWLGRKCLKGRVLFCNFEVDRASFITRLSNVVVRNGSDKFLVEQNLDVWNLRGRVQSPDAFVDELLEKTDAADYRLVVLDPVYKLMKGNENDSNVVADFAGLVDRIAEKGCSVVFSHHHPKGAQAGRSAMDRGSGSGVFARDADAIVDLVELESDGILPAQHSPFASAWRVSTVLREFSGLPTFEIWWDWPIHVLDETGTLADCRPAMGGDKRLKESPQARGAKSVRNCEKALEELYARKQPGELVLRSELMEALGASDVKTVNGWIDASASFERRTGGPGGRCVVARKAEATSDGPSAT